MSYATDHPTRCLKPKCKASVPGSRHHHIRASEAGWFFPADGKGGYCPEHVPGWVAEWRARKASGK